MYHRCISHDGASDCYYIQGSNIELYNNTMVAKIISSDKQNEWDLYLQNHAHAIAWQHWQWYEIVKRHYPCHFLPIAAIYDKKICGVLPLYSLKNQFIAVPYAVAGGIVADTVEAEQILLTKAIELSQNNPLILRQYKHKINSDMRIDENYYNRELLIDRDINEIWNELSPENRDHITHAQSCGFSLEYPSSSLDEFYTLLLRYTRATGVPCVSKQWIIDLVTSGMYSCALVRFQKRVIAGTLVKTYKKTISFPFTALTNMSYQAIDAAYWLYWELINLFRLKEYQIAHSGRIPHNDAAPQFRLGWGGTKFQYYNQYYPKTTATENEFKRRRGFKRKLFSLVWKHTPLSVTALIGPLLTKKFP